MKKLVLCLSLIGSLTVVFNVSAESPIPVEPIFLEALFAQSGKLDVKDPYESSVKLSEILAQSMGYPQDEDTVLGVSHYCDYEESVHVCRLTIDSTSKEDGVVVDESDVIITYSAEFVKRSRKVKISNVKVDYAG